MSKNPWNSKTSYISQNARAQLLPVAKEFTHSIKIELPSLFRAFATQSGVLHLFCPKNVQKTNKQNKPQITFHVCYIFSWILSYAH